MIMSIKFEEQFKYRDESNLKTGTGPSPSKRKSRCAAAVSGKVRDSIYPRLSRNDNHRGNARRRVALGPFDAAKGENWCQGQPRVAEENEGVGEHVRTRSHTAVTAGETADPRSAPLKKNRFFCRIGSCRASPGWRCDPAV
jgi:hypothetical protein